jgi:hypothetical protein
MRTVTFPLHEFAERVKHSSLQIRIAENQLEFLVRCTASNMNYEYISGRIKELTEEMFSLNQSHCDYILKAYKKYASNSDSDLITDIISWNGSSTGQVTVEDEY